MKLIFQSLFIALSISVALAILQFFLSFFGIYIIAYAFYILSILPSVFSAIAFEKFFGINLYENQTLFGLIVCATIYLIFAFFIYLFLSVVKEIKSLKLK